MANPKASQMPTDCLHACCLRCTIKLPQGDVGKKVYIDTGDWFCINAGNEIAKPYTKMAKKDLRQRQLRQKTTTEQFKGEFGRVKIGGKMFSYFPIPNMLVRDDFADWCERHAHEVWDFDKRCEILPDKPTHENQDVEEESIKSLFIECRKKALKMGNVTGIIEPNCWGNLWQMRAQYTQACNAMIESAKQGQLFIGTKVLVENIGAHIAFREKNYADCVRFYTNCAAAALRAAQYVTEVAEKERKNV